MRPCTPPSPRFWRWRSVFLYLRCQSLQVCFHHLRININLLDPGILYIRITLPMNQKLTLFTHNTVIQDSLDDILIVFCVDGGWFWRDTPRKENGVIVMSTFKATGVDFGVDGSDIRLTT